MPTVKPNKPLDLVLGLSAPMPYQWCFEATSGDAMDNHPEDHPIKKVMISALIVVVIVGLMIGLMVLGEFLVNWL